MKTIHKITPLFFLVYLSSCGLIERFKTPTEPTTSESSTATTTENNEDAFFSEAFNETKASEEVSDLQSEINKDSPSQIMSDVKQDVQSDLDQFEKEISGQANTALNTDQKIEIKEEAPVVTQSSFNEAGNLTAETGTYTVNSGETLMQISFKLYGDLSKWKTLRDLNAGSLTNGTLRKGMKIKYYVPETPFTWNPEGSAYLIKNGDTLGTISNSVYQTPKKWKKIWENNKPLIKNPNKIYAGFTLYYLTEGIADNNMAPTSTDRENYVEKTSVDKMAEKEMQAFQSQQLIESNNTSASATVASDLDQKIDQLTITDAQTLGAENTAEEVLTVQPLNKDDALMEEIETINAEEIASLKKTDEFSTELDESVSNTQSAVQK